MKRLILLFVLLLAVPAALAQQSGSNVLTNDGSLVTATVEWSHEHPEADASSKTYVVLTSRHPEEGTRRIFVPSTREIGSNSNPALAYDGDSDTLFVFWQYTPNAMSSELRFISLDRDGNWSAPKAFESAAYHLRRNLRIAVTSKARDKADDGEITIVPELNVHAVWWEQSGAGEMARYAMITTNPEAETSVQVYDLASFIKTKSKKHDVGAEFNLEILRHPALFESTEGDAVDVLFGDLETNSFRRVTLSPIGNARVRVPVGIQDKGIGPPSFSLNTKSSPIEATSPHPDRMAFYFHVDGAVHYITYRDGKWSDVKLIKLDDGVTRETAVSAVRGLVGMH